MADQQAASNHEAQVTLANSSTSAETTTLTQMPSIPAQPNGTTMQVHPAGSNSQSGRYAQPPVAGATGGPSVGANRSQVAPEEAARGSGAVDVAGHPGWTTARVQSLALESRASGLFQDLRQLLTVFPTLLREPAVHDLQVVAMKLMEDDQEDAARIQQKSGEILARTMRAMRGMRESGGEERETWRRLLEKLKEEAEEVVGKGWVAKKVRMYELVVALELAWQEGVKVFDGRDGVVRRGREDEEG